MLYGDREDRLAHSNQQANQTKRYGRFVWGGNIAVSPTMRGNLYLVADGVIGTIGRMPTCSATFGLGH